MTWVDCLVDTLVVHIQSTDFSRVASIESICISGMRPLCIGLPHILSSQPSIWRCQSCWPVPQFQASELDKGIIMRHLHFIFNSMQYGQRMLLDFRRPCYHHSTLSHVAWLPGIHAQALPFRPYRDQPGIRWHCVHSRLSVANAAFGMVGSATSFGFDCGQCLLTTSGHEAKQMLFIKHGDLQLLPKKMKAFMHHIGSNSLALSWQCLFCVMVRAMSDL